MTHTVTSTDSSYSGASASSVTVTITDDEVPVTVSFGQANYTVAEGDPVSVTVTLSADPERTVVIPLTHTPQGNTTSTDYSGVPANVTFSTGDMSQTITFTATQDDVDDGGKSVLLAFGTLLPAGSAWARPRNHRQHHRRRWRRGLGLRKLANHRGGQFRHVHH